MSPDETRDPGGPKSSRGRLVSDRDEDDWVGEPPEGRHTRDRARPDAWHDWRAALAGVGMLICLLILALVLLL